MNLLARQKMQPTEESRARCTKSPRWCAENMAAGVKSPLRTHSVGCLPAKKNRELVGQSTLKMSSTDPHLQLKRTFKKQRPT